MFLFSENQRTVLSVLLSVPEIRAHSGEETEHPLFEQRHSDERQ